MADERNDPDPDAASGPRDIVVPLRVYKAVTVFSTLFAIGTVVLGFVALDTATQRARAPPGEIDPLLAAVGLGAIVFGGAVYAFAARFRAPGMGKANDADDEPPDDG